MKISRKRVKHRVHKTKRRLSKRRLSKRRLNKRRLHKTKRRHRNKVGGVKARNIRPHGGQFSAYKKLPNDNSCESYTQHDLDQDCGHGLFIHDGIWYHCKNPSTFSRKKNCRKSFTSKYKVNDISDINSIKYIGSSGFNLNVPMNYHEMAAERSGNIEELMAETNTGEPSHPPISRPNFSFSAKQSEDEYQRLHLLAEKLKTEAENKLNIAKRELTEDMTPREKTHLKYRNELAEQEYKKAIDEADILENEAMKIRIPIQQKASNVRKGQNI